VVRALRQWLRGLSFVFRWQLLRVLFLDDYVLDWSFLLQSYMYGGDA
jgi:hypothetical protein